MGQGGEPQHLAAHAGVGFHIAIVAGGEGEPAARLGAGLGRDVVDDPADGLGAEPDLTRPLQHLNSFEAADRRVIIAGVVAIGGEAQRQAVFQQQDLGGSRGIEAPNADIGPHSHAFFLAGENAGRLTQRLIDRQGPQAAQVFGLDGGAGAGDVGQLPSISDDDHGVERRRLLGGLGREG